MDQKTSKAMKTKKIEIGWAGQEES